MSNNQLAGFPAFGSRVDSTITYHPKTIIFDPILDLPTGGFPGTPQIEFEITIADLPSINGAPYIADGAFGSNYLIYVFVGISNSYGSTNYIYLSSKYINPSTWNDSSFQGIATGYYGTLLTTACLQSPSIGSTQQYRLYSYYSGAKLEWAKMVIVPTYLLKQYRGVKDLTIETSVASIIGGTVQSTDDSIYIYGYNGAADFYHLQTASTLSMQYWNPSSLYGVVATTRYPYQSIVFSTSAINNKPHRQFRYPTRIAYTPIL